MSLFYKYYKSHKSNTADIRYSHLYDTDSDDIIYIHIHSTRQADIVTSLHTVQEVITQV
jgi:hypothetical protein